MRGIADRIFAVLLTVTILAASGTLLMDAAIMKHQKHVWRIQYELSKLSHTSSAKAILLSLDKLWNGGAVSDRQQLSQLINNGLSFEHRIFDARSIESWTDSSSGLVFELKFGANGQWLGWTLLGANQIPESLESPSTVWRAIENIGKPIEAFYNPFFWTVVWVLTAVAWLLLEGLNSDIAIKRRRLWAKALLISSVGIAPGCLAPLIKSNGPSPLADVGLAFVTLAVSLFLLQNAKEPIQIDFSNCDSCGYNLTGNTSGICPECGNPIISKSEITAP